VRGRLILTLFVLGIALCASAGASAYPWPVKPFNTQHPIRANFGDPRTVFQHTLLTNGLEGPGAFQFHNGIDISAPDGTPVYPVVSGIVRVIDSGALSVRTDDGRVFQYFHIMVSVRDGQRAVALRTVLGHVMRPYAHVHLTEIRGHTVWNPLARGGIAPYRDHTVPDVDSIIFRPVSSLLPLDPARVCGTISIITSAEDSPVLPIPGAFAGYPVSPALLTWTLARFGGSTYVRDATAADFRTTLPLRRDFWNVYARGSFQNAPRFGNRQYFMPGRFLYNLATVFDTRSYPNGTYEVIVRASDMRGNEAELAQRFTIINETGTESGCPPQEEPSSEP
jgi:hypothetical protein